MELNSESLLDKKQAATFLNLKISKIDKLVMLKDIPFLKIGRHVRFEREDLEEFKRAKKIMIKN